MITTIEIHFPNGYQTANRSRLEALGDWQSLGDGYVNLTVELPSDVDEVIDYLDEISVEWRLV